MHLEAGTWSFTPAPPNSNSNTHRPKQNHSLLTAQCINTDYGIVQASTCLRQTLTSPLSSEEFPIYADDSLLCSSPTKPSALKDQEEEEFSQLDLSQSTLLEIERAMMKPVQDPEPPTKRSFAVLIEGGEEKENAFGATQAVVNASALKKAALSERINEDLFGQVDSLLAETGKEMPFGAFGGFATAGGKKVEIGKAAIKKAESFLKLGDLSEPIAQLAESNSPKEPIELNEGLGKEPLLAKNVQLSNVEIEKVGFSMGFSTAAGKKVTVQKSSLQKAEILFQSAANASIEVQKREIPLQNAVNASIEVPSNNKASIAQNHSSSSAFHNPPFIPPKQKITKTLPPPPNPPTLKQVFDLETLNNPRPSLESFLSTLPPPSKACPRALSISLEEISSLIKLRIPQASDAWISNHFSLLYWKYNSLYCTYYPHFPVGAADLICELLYRWQQEKIEGNRSIVQKIVERDTCAAIHLILLVVDIVIGDGSVFFLVLSDGWYRVRAKVDEPMKWLIVQKKIFIGQKLHIYGSVLEAASFEGTSILEAFESSTLRIFTNATRPAHAHAALGRARRPCFTLPLASIFADGGLIPCIDVVVQRTYPQSYLKGGTVLTEAAYLSKLQGHNWKDGEEFQEEVKSYTCLFKFQISDYSPNSAATQAREAVFTFWRPSEDVIESIKEGSRLLIYNSRAASNFRGVFTLSNTASTVISIQPTLAEDSVMGKCFKKRLLIRDYSLVEPGTECDICAVAVEGVQVLSESSASVTLRDAEGNLGLIKVPQEQALQFGRSQGLVLKNVWCNFYDNNRGLYVFSFNEFSVVEREKGK